MWRPGMNSNAVRECGAEVAAHPKIDLPRICQRTACRRFDRLIGRWSELRSDGNKIGLIGRPRPQDAAPDGKQGLQLDGKLRRTRVRNLRSLRTSHPRMDLPCPSDCSIHCLRLPRKIVRLVHDLPVRKVGGETQTRKFCQKSLRVRRVVKRTTAMRLMTNGDAVLCLQLEGRFKKTRVVREAEPVRAGVAIDPHRAASQGPRVKPPQRFGMRCRGVTIRDNLRNKFESGVLVCRTHPVIRLEHGGKIQLGGIEPRGFDFREKLAQPEVRKLPLGLGENQIHQIQRVIRTRTKRLDNPCMVTVSVTVTGPATFCAPVLDQMTEPDAPRSLVARTS